MSTLRGFYRRGASSILCGNAKAKLTAGGKRLIGLHNCQCTGIFAGAPDVNDPDAKFLNMSCCGATTPDGYSDVQDDDGRWISGDPIGSINAVAADDDVRHTYHRLNLNGIFRQTVANGLWFASAFVENNSGPYTINGQIPTWNYSTRQYPLMLFGSAAIVNVTDGKLDFAFEAGTRVFAIHLAPATGECAGETVGLCVQAKTVTPITTAICFPLVYEEWMAEHWEPFSCDPEYEGDGGLLPSPWGDMGLRNNVCRLDKADDLLSADIVKWPRLYASAGCWHTGYGGTLHFAVHCNCGDEGEYSEGWTSSAKFANPTKQRASIDLTWVMISDGVSISLFCIGHLKRYVEAWWDAGVEQWLPWPEPFYPFRIYNEHNSPGVLFFKGSASRPTDWFDESGVPTSEVAITNELAVGDVVWDPHEMLPGMYWCLGSIALITLGADARDAECIDYTNDANWNEGDVDATSLNFGTNDCSQLADAPGDVDQQPTQWLPVTSRCNELPRMVRGWVPYPQYQPRQVLELSSGNCVMVLSKSRNLRTGNPGLVTSVKAPLPQGQVFPASIYGSYATWSEACAALEQCKLPPCEGDPVPCGGVCFSSTSKVWINSGLVTIQKVGGPDCIGSVLESAVFDSTTAPADLVDGTVFGIPGKVALFQSGNFRLAIVYECTPGDEESGGTWWMVAGYDGITESISPVIATSSNGCVALFVADNCHNAGGGISLRQIMDSALAEVIDNGCCNQAGECRAGAQNCTDGGCI